jgi:two-component system NarL family sensor kinase
MSAIKYSLERAVELDRQGRGEHVQVLLIRLVERVQKTIGEIRSIAMNLRPSVLDDLGVASALTWLCREFGETYPDIGVHPSISTGDQEVPERLATAIFRCTQELLNNIAKHAGASHVSVALCREGRALTLRVCDDGVGISDAGSAESFPRGHGVSNLRERTQMTGGQFALTSEPGCGTCVRIEWFLTPTEVSGAGCLTE